MKKLILILVMISSATLAYNQSSRRTTSAKANTDRNNTTRSRTYEANRNANRTVTANNRNVTTTNRANTTHRKSEVSANNRTNTTHRKSEVSANNRTNTTHRRSQVSNNNKHTEYRTTHRTHYNHTSKPYSRTVYTHRRPTHINVVWTSDMHHHYVKMYPNHRRWHYTYGSRVSTIPANSARYYIGDVKSVYGRVTDVYYLRETDEYILYVGRFYPNQHFTVVIPGYIAHQKSRRPIDYYMYQDIHVTGLISAFEGKPEVLVKRNSQLCMY